MAHHCWACSIPEIVWAKLALLNTFVWYDVSAETVFISHPGLLAAEITREKAYRLAKAQKWGAVLPVPAAPIQHQWRVVHWKGMAAADWESLVTEIADAVARHQYAFLP